MDHAHKQPPGKHGCVRLITSMLDFTGDGLYEWNGTNWTRITTSHPATMIGSSTSLYAEFTGDGLYQWNGTSWILITTSHPGIYPGIDMKIYGTNNQLEYDLIVSPGTDPNKIRLSYSGAKNLSLTKQGDLAIGLNVGSILQKKPVIYQTINNTRKEIEGKFILADATTYRFEIGSYDTRHPLVIDPGVGLLHLSGGKRLMKTLMPLPLIPRGMPMWQELRPPRTSLPRVLTREPTQEGPPMPS